MHRLILAGLLAMVVASPSARAQALASGPVFAAGQQAVICEVYNAGSTAVSVGGLKIIAQFSPYSVTIGSDATCIGTLNAGAFCRFAATTQAGAAHLCRLVVSLKSNMRGTMQIVNESQVLAIVEMY